MCNVFWGIARYYYSENPNKLSFELLRGGGGRKWGVKEGKESLFIKLERNCPPLTQQCRSGSCMCKEIAFFYLDVLKAFFVNYSMSSSTGFCLMACDTQLSDVFRLFKVSMFLLPVHPSPSPSPFWKLCTLIACAIYFCYAGHYVTASNYTIVSFTQCPVIKFAQSALAIVIKLDFFESHIFFILLFF